MEHKIDEIIKCCMQTYNGSIIEMGQAVVTRLEFMDNAIAKLEGQLAEMQMAVAKGVCKCSTPKKAKPTKEKK